MTYFLLKLPHYSRIASVRADEVVTRPGGDVATSPLRLRYRIAVPLIGRLSGRLKSALAGRKRV
jgi:hypothetical protein